MLKLKEKTDFKTKILLAVSILLFLIIVAFASGCNFNAQKVGGNITIDLPPNTKFVNATWKNNSLWYVTRPARATDVADSYTFKEDSNFGILEGAVTFIEHF